MESFKKKEAAYGRAKAHEWEGGEGEGASGGREIGRDLLSSFITSSFQVAAAVYEAAAAAGWQRALLRRLCLRNSNM